MNRVAVIGGGVAGLASAQILKDRADVVVFERENRPGGLIRCADVDGGLFHLCGGHVFNTKDDRVAKWFWGFFDRERDFLHRDRYSAICLDGKRFVGYPIENHIYQLPDIIQKKIYSELVDMMSCVVSTPKDFREFLLNRFGKTLCDIYFYPYNEKIWKCDLSQIPLSWLEGKLPMPKLEDILRANRERTEEKEFVHSTFFYPKKGGSQFIADTLARGLNVRTSECVNMIEPQSDGGSIVNGEFFDEIVFCGNIKSLPGLLRGVEMGSFANEISRFESHGTTSVFCEMETNPYSWFYQPTRNHDSHRIICTGNFSPNNNALMTMTGTVEFTGAKRKNDIVDQLSQMPFNPRYLCHHYSEYAYPIQHVNTRRVVSDLKLFLSKYNISLVGRFAEWEYYNMDAAIASALRQLSR